MECLAGRRAAMRFALLGFGWALVLISACSDNNPGTGSASSDGGVTSSSTSADPHAACDAYLKCVTDAEPTALPEAIQAYGPNGSCWSGGAQIASDCDAACASSMSQVSAAFPHFASCAGAGGSVVGSGDTTPDASANSGSGSIATGPAFGFDDACSNCAQDSCASDENTCLASSACESVMQCMTACDGVVSCKNACESSAGTAKSATQDADAFASCLSAKCADECQGF
jgi:hypothetical protein